MKKNPDRENDSQTCMVLITNEIKHMIYNLNMNILINLSLSFDQKMSHRSFYVIVCNIVQYELDNIILHGMHNYIWHKMAYMGPQIKHLTAF